MTDRKPNAETEAALQDSRDGKVERTSMDELAEEGEEVQVTLNSQEVCPLMQTIMTQLDHQIFTTEGPHARLTSACALAGLGYLLAQEEGAELEDIMPTVQKFSEIFATGMREIIKE